MTLREKWYPNWPHRPSGTTLLPRFDPISRLKDLLSLGPIRRWWWWRGRV